MNNKNEKGNNKPKDKKMDKTNLILTGIMIAGSVSAGINANKLYQSNELLTLDNNDMKENITMVDNYKESHKTQFEKDTKAMLSQASDQLKKGNKNFAVEGPVEVPQSYYESRKIIEQFQGQHQFENIQNTTNIAGSLSVAALASIAKRLKNGPKDKKNKKD